MESEKLKPYKSFLLCSISDVDIQKVCLDIEALIKNNNITIKTKNKFNDSALEISLFTYLEKKTPSWCKDLTIKDVINQLVLLVKKNNYIALYTSDPAVKEKIRNYIVNKKKEKEKKFTYLKLVSRGHLNAAFVRGQTQTLWLSGTHKRVASKVDNKIITGIDLQYALDPLGDQSFFYTAARCKLPSDIFSDPIGTSPRKSTLWAGISKDWSDFIKSINMLLTLLEEVKKPNYNPLPVLATSINSTEELKSIGKSYDAAIIPPILLAETDIDPDERKKAERWSNLTFDITPGNNSLNFKAEVSLLENGKDNIIGTFSFTFADFDRLPQIDWEVEGKIHTEGNQKIFNDALEMFINDKDWLKIWYDSGHVIAEREIFLPRFRDIPFSQYEGRELTGFNIKKEKPPNPIDKNIGKYKSLFCYVQKTLTKGWLTCDDGSMEMADFIHLDKISGKPTISLIHVKASKKDEPKRDLSVSDYEVVVSQAVKNIRYLNRDNLLEGLTAGLEKKIQNATWKDGKKQSDGRKEMLKAIEKHGTNIAYRVIVFQPRARIPEIEKARENK
ncbi:MAG: hypothetical protein MUP45_01500, partial [Candidatus Marinimicrobia bacterium]|nr:hypothetical protein [Candidatus Neomarinimicrobiota bacterium]